MGETPINDSVINEGYKSNLNDSLINESMRARQVEATADTLVRAYQAPNMRKFFMKAAWHLPEHFLRTVVEASRDKKVINQIGYFIQSCKNEMRLRQNHK